MGWRMNNINSYNIFGVHGKIWVLGGGRFHKKPIYIEDCLKRVAWTFDRFRGSCQERREWCFWGGDTPMHAMHYEVFGFGWCTKHKILVISGCLLSRKVWFFLEKYYGLSESVAFAHKLSVLLTRMDPRVII